MLPCALPSKDHSTIQSCLPINMSHLPRDSIFSLLVSHACHIYLTSKYAMIGCAARLSQMKQPFLSRSVSSWEVS